MRSSKQLKPKPGNALFGPAIWFRMRCLALLLALASPLLRAQMDQAIVTGTVIDTSGAAIPGANLRLQSTDTGFEFKARADQAGIYAFPPVKIGMYRLSAAAPGFETTTQENISLDVQQKLNVALVLRPGSVSQTVTVSALPPTVNTEDSSVGQVMDAQTVNDTPLNGRNWVYIAQLAAGVDPSNGSRGGGSGDFNANGQRAEQNNFIIDGIDNNTYIVAFLNKQSYIIQPPPDALSEFKVQTSDYSAEFGRSAGAVVNTSIRSGTNNIHGDLWEYLRNTALDARDFNAQTIPPYHENQFGATLGAPLLRNKLFFFGYTEANRIVFAQTGTFSVATPKMRIGDFSELLQPSLTKSGKPIHLFVPGSAGTVPLACNGSANVICPGQINPVAQTLLSLEPLPNANSGKLFQNYVSNLKDTDNTFQWGTRLDYNISDKDQFFVRFSYLNNPQYNPPPFGLPLDAGTASDGHVINFGEQFAASETHTFSPTLTNEFRVGYTYSHAENLQHQAGLDVSPSLGLGGIPYQPGEGGLPNISLTELTTIGSPQYHPSDRFQDVAELLDNVSKIVGNHSLRFGLQLLNIRLPRNTQPQAPRGAYTYDDLFTGKPGAANTGYGTASFLLDQQTSASLSDISPFDEFRWYRSGYAEDTWKATPKLTLNLGLRYDSFQPVQEVKGRQANFIPNGPVLPGQGTADFVLTPQQANTPLSPAFLSLLAASKVTVQTGTNPALVSSPRLNFAPRMGIAYAPDPQTAIRAGFGMFYGGLETIGGFVVLPANYPFQFTSNFSSGSCLPGHCPTDGISLESGFSQSISKGLLNFVSQPFLNGQQTNTQTPYSENYNLTFEHSFGEQLVASVAYVGAVDRHLEVGPDSNGAAALTDPRLNFNLARPFPKLFGATISRFIGVSNYNGLQTRMERRLHNGYSFLATYTWARSMDDAPTPLGSTGDTGFRGYNLIGLSPEYSRSPWDTRNRVTFNGYGELPFGSGRRFLNHNRLLNVLIGGYAADLVFTAQSGFPFSVGTDLGNAGPNGASASNAVLIRNPFAPGGTPDASNPGIQCASQTRTKEHWYNPCAFANPPLAFPQASVAGSPVSPVQITGLAALPYLGGKRNIISGPGYERINASLFKRFSTIREQYLEFRADAFNVLNTPAYGNPSVADDSTNGGSITAPRSFQYLTPDARFFQVSAKYAF